MLIKHEHLTGDNVHVAHAFEYANRVERLAATGFKTIEIGRLAIQLDTGGYWRLEGVDPTSWVPAYGNSMFQRLQAEELTNIVYNESNKIIRTNYGNGVYCIVDYNVSGKTEFISFFNSEEVLIEKWQYTYDEQERVMAVAQIA